MNPGFEEIMGIRGRGMPAHGEVTITGRDPVFSARFRIGETTANILAASASRDRHPRNEDRPAPESGYRRPQCGSDVPELQVLSEPKRTGTGNGASSPSMEHMRSITQPWRCKDGRWYLPHFNLPHLHDRVIGVLVRIQRRGRSESGSEMGFASIWKKRSPKRAHAAPSCAPTRSGSSIRTAKMLAGKPLVDITKIGDSEPDAFPQRRRPSRGIKVLDLTRILAGPIAARTLAENGADVLMVTAQHLPQVPEHVKDTSHGKRSCFLNSPSPTTLRPSRNSFVTPTCSARAIVPASWTSTA